MNLAEHDSGTKRSAIFEELRRNILEKRYANGKLPSERALMRRFSVSRTHIRSILDELKAEGYIFARQGSGMYVSRRARTMGGEIGIMITGAFREGEGGVLPTIIAEFAREAGRNGYGVEMVEVLPDGAVNWQEKLLRIARNLVDKGVSGVIYQPIDFPGDSPAVNRSVLSLFDKAGIPVALFDYDIVPTPERSEYDLVGIDNFDAGRLIGQCLVRSGAKRIAFMMEDNWSLSVLGRMEGVKYAVSMSGCAAHDFAIYSMPEDTAALSRILGKRNRPDAIICGNDFLAIRLMAALEKLGMRVPEDLMVAGFDDIPLASLQNPPLTTIRQPCASLAQTLFAALSRRMADPSLPPSTIYMNATLVERASTMRSTTQSTPPRRRHDARRPKERSKTK